jgi:hypothetical protein
MSKLEYDKVVAEIRGYSQKGQDSFIEYTFDKIGATNRYYVEFGAAEWPQVSNTAWFFMNGWKGLLLEGDEKYRDRETIPNANYHIERISKENICELFRKYEVPVSPDLVSIDLDSMDYWVTDAMLQKYSPRVIMVENNVRFEPLDSQTRKYDPDWNWSNNGWYGASPYAFKKMFNSHGYTPVWIHLDDMIAIRNDVLADSGFDQPSWEYVYPVSRPELYWDHNGEYNPEDWMTV